MSLAELSAQYEESAKLLSERLSILRRRLKETDDPDELWHIKRRITDLAQMLTQMNDLAWLTKNYYVVGGGDYDPRYAAFNGKQRRKRVKYSLVEGLDADSAKRVNKMSKVDIFGLLLQGQEHPANSPGEGCQQEHCMQDTAPCRNEDKASDSVRKLARMKSLF